MHKLLGNGGISSKVIHINRLFLNTILRGKNIENSIFQNSFIRTVKKHQ